MSYDTEPKVLLLSFEGLVSITNNFSDEYLIKETSIAKMYKVKISSSQLFVKEDDKEDGEKDGEEDDKEDDEEDGEKDDKEDDKEDDEKDDKEDDEEDLFDIVIRRSTNGRQHREMNNDLMLSLYSRHTNILPILGVFLEDDAMHEVIIVTKYEVNGSLDKHLSDPTTLTWIRRLRICVGVARAMSYLHYGLKKQSSVIHGNIQSSRILLDDKWEPKLYGFQYSIVCHRQQLCLTSKYEGTIQYMDPAYEKTGGLTLKSDVFSFGVVLFEVLFGRKASIVNEDKWYFAKLAKRHYEETILDHMIDPVLREQMDTQSLDIFAKTAYYCLNEQRAQRLNTHEVVERLEEALDHQMKYENPVRFISIYLLC
ncbi:kinase-like domain-containing protein [Tanacetum coccineum]|uniref:Kinase-like domain-containing protein n=1 Tax=Tanacetum coccineum TaxID=301880 RepID=A0ABQ4ZA78_9ASTR